MFPSIRPDPIPVERRWRCQPIEPGHQVKGFKVGPLVCCVVHWSGSASKPCHSAMTNGRVSCPCEETKIAKRKIGYLPLVTLLGERIVVIVSNTIALAVDPLPHAAPICLTRTLVPCAPLLYGEWKEYECSGRTWEQVKKWKPVSIEAWLLHLWGDELLTSFYAGMREISTTAPTPLAPSPACNSALVSPPPARENDPVKLPSLISPRRKRNQAG